MHSDKLTNQFWLKESYVTIFFHWVIDNFLKLLFKIKVLSILRIVDFLKIFVLSESIQNTLWISLLAGNVRIHPPRVIKYGIWKYKLEVWIQKFGLLFFE